MCGRGWPSNRVMVIFHMRLTYGQGIVKVRYFRQNCKMCTAAPMEKPSITSDNIEVVLENLVKKIRIKCYHEDLDRGYRPSVPLDVNSPHEPAHCEGCIEGICNRSWTCVTFKSALSLLMRKLCVHRLSCICYCFPSCFSEFWFVKLSKAHEHNPSFSCWQAVLF